MTDLETLDMIKADVNVVKQLEEKLDRLDRQVQERLADLENSEEELYGEESDHEELDPEELKD